MNSTKLPCCQWIPIPEISSVAPEMPVMRDVRFPSYKWMVFRWLSHFYPFVHHFCPQILGLLFSKWIFIRFFGEKIHQNRILLRFLAPTICLCLETVPLVAAMPTSLHGPHCTATTVSPKAFIGAWNFTQFFSEKMLGKLATYGLVEEILHQLIIPLFIRFYTSQVVQDFFHQQFDHH